MEVHPSLLGSLYGLPILSGGVSGLVFKLPDCASVVKVACGSELSKEQLATESRIYNRLGSHPCITRYLYTYKRMIVLEHLQYPLRKRLWDLNAASAVPSEKDVLRWAIQISQGLQHAHAHGVFQVDIGPHNILLDWSDNAKLSDFAGSSIDGSAPAVFPSTHSEHPNLPDDEPSTQSELFALGSTLYEIETTRQPYHDKSDKAIEDLFKAGDFPDTSPLMLGQVINKCWNLQYREVGEVVKDVVRIQSEYTSMTERQRGFIRWKQSRTFISFGIIIVVAIFIRQNRARMLGWISMVPCTVYGWSRSAWSIARS